jgi:hypothetical protein
VQGLYFDTSGRTSYALPAFASSAW